MCAANRIKPLTALLHRSLKTRAYEQNLDKWDITGSENFLFGKGFGITTGILTGPNGNLFVVSLTNGAVYEIFRRPSAASH